MVWVGCRKCGAITPIKNGAGTWTRDMVGIFTCPAGCGSTNWRPYKDLLTAQHFLNRKGISWYVYTGFDGGA